MFEFGDFDSLKYQFEEFGVSACLFNFCKEEKREAKNSCPNCGEMLHVDDYQTVMLCKKCGLTEDIVGEHSSLDTETSGGSDNNPVTLNLGTNNSKMIISSQAGCKMNQIIDLEKTLTEMVKKNAREGKEIIAHHTIQKAVSMYVSCIQENKIVRNSNKKGALAECLYKTLIGGHRPKDYKEMSNILGLSQPIQTKGRKILYNMQSQGKAALPSTRNYIDIVIEAKSAEFGLETPDMNLVKELVNCMEKRRVASSSNSLAKCASAFYILFLKKPQLGKTCSDVLKTCGMSKATFDKPVKEIYQIMINGNTFPNKKAAFEAIFIKYGFEATPVNISKRKEYKKRKVTLPIFRNRNI